MRFLSYLYAHFVSIRQRLIHARVERQLSLDQGRHSVYVFVTNAIRSPDLGL